MGDQERVRITDKRGGKSWIVSEQTFQSFDRHHPRKTSTNDDNTCLDGARRFGWVVFWPQPVRREIAHPLGKQTQARAIEDPTDHLGKEQAHPLHSPLWLLTRQDREQDATDASP